MEIEVQGVDPSREKLLPTKDVHFSSSTSRYDDSAAKMIVSNRIPECLNELDDRITEKLKRLIFHCWHYDRAQRPKMNQILPHFTAGSVLLRRHSTSEPKLN